MHQLPSRVPRQQEQLPRCSWSPVPAAATLRSRELTRLEDPGAGTCTVPIAAKSMTAISAPCALTTAAAAGHRKAVDDPQPLRSPFRKSPTSPQQTCYTRLLV